MEKLNFPENSLIYFNQAYLTVKKNKKIFYCNFSLLGQIVEVLNLLQDVSSHTLREDELKMVKPRYNAETGKFLGLYEKIGYMVIGGSPKEVFLNYGFDKEKSKVLYSHYRRRIMNPFCGTVCDDVTNSKLDDVLPVKGLTD